MVWHEEFQVWDWLQEWYCGLDDLMLSQGTVQRFCLWITITCFTLCSLFLRMSSYDILANLPSFWDIVYYKMAGPAMQWKIPLCWRLLQQAEPKIKFVLLEIDCAVP